MNNLVDTKNDLMYLIENGILKESQVHEIAEQMKKNDPQRFQNINGERLLRNINGKLDMDRNMSKSHKEFKRDVLGYSNAFQKEGGTKNNTSSVIKNNVMITYQD